MVANALESLPILLKHVNLLAGFCVAGDGALPLPANFLGSLGAAPADSFCFLSFLDWVA
jgi:hypothetical protein